MLHQRRVQKTVRNIQNIVVVIEVYVLLALRVRVALRLIAVSSRLARGVNVLVLGIVPEIRLSHIY